MRTKSQRSALFFSFFSVGQVVSLRKNLAITFQPIDRRLNGFLSCTPALFSEATTCQIMDVKLSSKLAELSV